MRTRLRSSELIVGLACASKAQAKSGVTPGSASSGQTVGKGESVLVGNGFSGVRLWLEVLFGVAIRLSP